MTDTRQAVEIALRKTFSGNQTIDTWMEYYDRVWANEETFDAHMFLVHSWDHEYFVTDDFEASWKRFRANLMGAAQL